MQKMRKLLYKHKLCSFMPFSSPFLILNIYIFKTYANVRVSLMEGHLLPKIRP